MSSMSMVNVVVIDTRFSCFVNWWGYKVVCVSRYCASFVFIFWYSNVNIPCTLFPCSKFSHRVFIWQGFLTRQGSWMIEDLMFHPFPDLRFKFMLIWMFSFDHVTWCCYAEILSWRFYLWLSVMLHCYCICFFLLFDCSIYACYDCLRMVMFGALLVDSF